MAPSAPVAIASEKMILMKAGPSLTGSRSLNTVTEAPTSGQHGSANDTMAVAVYGPLLRPKSFRPLSSYLAHMTRSDTNEKLMMMNEA